jgi:hypothetical protein
MQLKHATFMDKHVEKLILGGGVLIALIIILLYFTGSPYDIEVGGKQVTPEDVEKNILAPAQELKSKIGKNAPADSRIKIEIPLYDKQFRSRQQQRPLSNLNYDVPLAKSGLDPRIVGGEGPGSETIIAVTPVAPPAASDVKIVQRPYVLATQEELEEYFFTLLSEQNTADEDAITAKAKSMASEVAKKINTRGPGDFNAVTISATIKPQARKEAYEAVDEENRMYESWYKDLMEFVSDVVIEREELDPATGKWGKKTIIDPLPGSMLFTLRQYCDIVEGNKKNGDDKTVVNENIQNLVHHLAARIDDVTKPKFVLHQPHRRWLFPDETETKLSKEDERRYHKVRQNILDLEAKARRLEGLLNKRSNRNTTGNTGNIPNRDFELYPEGGNFDPGAGNRGGSRGGARPPRNKPAKPGEVKPNTAATRNQKALDKIIEQLEELYIDRDDILNPPVDADGDGKPDARPDVRNPRGRVGSEYDPELNPDFRNYGKPGRRPIRPRVGDGFREGRGLGTEGEDAEFPPIQLWANDYTVESGKTYRYNVIYKVINPLFNKEDRLSKETKKLASEIETASAPATTEAITIPPSIQYFIEKADLKSNKVTWGVYAIHNGYRIHKQFVTMPGDSIGDKTTASVPDPAEPGSKTQMPIDLTIPAVMVDVKKPYVTSALRDNSSISVMIANIADGSVEMRSVNGDLENDDRIRMDNEASSLAETAANTETGGRTGFRPGGIREPGQP